MKQLVKTGTSIKEWVQMFTDDLFQWAYHKTSSKETAEDLVQETFLAAYKGLDSFKEKSSPKTWLLSILNNKIIDHYRKNARTPKPLKYISEEEGEAFIERIFDEKGMWKNLESTANQWTDEEIHLLDNDGFNAIMDMCMDDLPVQWKSAVTSRYILEKKSKEICQELNVTLSNYWQIIHRAKLMLRQCLEMNWQQN
jgi:RNA polymerase sigma-70 factor (TIGR02943 family)